jgi:hypothetical protein
MAHFTALSVTEPLAKSECQRRALHLLAGQDQQNPGPVPGLAPVHASSRRTAARGSAMAFGRRAR